MPLITLGCGGVDISFLNDNIWDAICEISRLLDDKDFVITSTNEGKHVPNSFHYRNKAIDMRLPFDTDGKNREFLIELQNRLGIDYDILLESDHIHIEYDPKRS